MTTLADEFLADLEELDDASDVDQDAMDEDNEADLVLEGLKQNDVKSVAKLLRTEKLTGLLDKIDELEADPSKSTMVATETFTGEHDPEYKMIVQCNELVGDIGMEVEAVHKFIRDHYQPKFPELESLVPNALDYARVVQAMPLLCAVKNEMEMINVNLQGILPSATIMVVSVTGSTTNGQPLSEEEMQITLDACDEMLKLDASKSKILDFVEHRMSIIAPNLSAVVGSSVASKMLGAAGGLVGLAKLTSNAIQSLGSSKKALGGMSSKTAELGRGFIEDCDIVQQSPATIRIRVLRLVAGKATLALRVDASFSDLSGMQGQKFKEQITNTIDKWLEPPPPKIVKSMPAPDPTERKTRGGKRMRKIKERYKTSEIRAQANRLSFNAVEEGLYTGNTMQDLGMLGSGGSTVGKLRLSQAEEKQIKAAGSRALRKRARDDGGGNASSVIAGGGSVIPGKGSVIPGRGSSVIPGRGSIIPGRSTQVGARTGGTTGGTGTSGMSSSLAFTPIQGIELSNPNAMKEKEAAKKKAKSYFSDTDGFLNIRK